jgi:hypothetical protein
MNDLDWTKKVATFRYGIIADFVGDRKLAGVTRRGYYVRRQPRRTTFQGARDRPLVSQPFWAGLMSI